MITWCCHQPLKKKVLLIELTIPWEDCMEKANEGKRSKYEEQYQRRGWKVLCMPMKEACRGFASH